MQADKVEKLAPLAVGVTPPTSARVQPAQEKDKKKAKKEKSKGKKGDKAPAVQLGHVFGRPLEDVLKWQGTGSNLPKVVAETIKWLEENNAWNEEGLFRIPGQMVIINELKAKYDKGNARNLMWALVLNNVEDGTADLSGIVDIASVAGLLKLYLRELPEPLFVFRFYSTFLKIAKNTDTPSRLRNLRILLHGLPEANKAVVFHLLQFLAKVVEKESINRMSSSNLAMIFAPNLLKAEKEELSQIMMDAGYLNSIVRTLIEEVDYMMHKTDVPRSLRHAVEEKPPANMPLDMMQNSGSADNDAAKGSESANTEESTSEQKRKELEEIKKMLKEKEELLRTLKSQLEEEGSGDEEDDEEEDDDDDEEDEDDEEGENGAKQTEGEATHGDIQEKEKEKEIPKEEPPKETQEQKPEGTQQTEQPTTEEGKIKKHKRTKSKGELGNKKSNMKHKKTKSMGAELGGSGGGIPTRKASNGDVLINAMSADSVAALKKKNKAGKEKKKQND